MTAHPSCRPNPDGVCTNHDPGHDQHHLGGGPYERQCVFCGRWIAAARMFDAAARVCWRCHLNGVPT